MALIPEGARQEATEVVRWPLTVMGNVFVLPGVPEVFRHKLQVVEALVPRDSPFVSQAVYTVMDEGNLKPLLDAVVAAHPEVSVGSYPVWNEPSYKTKLTFDGLDAHKIARARQAFVALLPPSDLVRLEE